jgi:hypothetical protein
MMMVTRRFLMFTYAGGMRARFSQDLKRLQELPPSTLCLSQVYDLAACYPPAMVREEKKALQDLIVSMVQDQPILSVDISALEKRYGVSLVDKDTRAMFDVLYDATANLSVVHGLTLRLQTLVACPPESGSQVDAWVSECRKITKKVHSSDERTPYGACQPARFVSPSATGI